MLVAEFRHHFGFVMDCKNDPKLIDVNFWIFVFFFDINQYQL